MNPIYPMIVEEQLSWLCTNCGARVSKMTGQTFMSRLGGWMECPCEKTDRIVGWHIKKGGP